MKRLSIGIAIAVLLALGGGLVGTRILGRSAVETASPASKARYQCAMHPQIVSDKPELCPICGMRLQRVDEPNRPSGPRLRILDLAKREGTFDEDRPLPHMPPLEGKCLARTQAAVSENTHQRGVSPDGGFCDLHDERERYGNHRRARRPADGPGVCRGLPAPGRRGQASGNPDHLSLREEE